MPDPYLEPTTETSEQTPWKDSGQAPKPESAPDLKSEKIPTPEKKTEAPAPAKEQATAAVAPASSPVPPSPSASALDDIDQDRQLKILVDLAFTQGIDKAVLAARATENAYLIDKLHDTLVDELAEKLKNEGKLKEI
ncbi:MAG: hypothetical protein PHQ47_03900 [Candidatus Portnoybacteria bacterium]|nr:hypothetical protein [Candidatus Portnoybacteria bacterium]